MPPVWSILVFSIVIPLCCGFGGSWFQATLAHKFAKDRDEFTRREAAKAARDGRKREFLRFMGEWRTRVYRCQIASVVSENFPEEVAKFGGAYTPIEQDFTGDQQTKFHAMCDQIVAMTGAEVEENM